MMCRTIYPNMVTSARYQCAPDYKLLYNTRTYILKGPLLDYMFNVYLLWLMNVFVTWVTVTCFTTTGTVKPGNFWLGFTDIQNPREWKQAINSMALANTNFAPGLGRNGSLDHNCVYMAKNEDYLWKITSCTTRM